MFLDKNYIIRLEFEQRKSLCFAVALVRGCWILTIKSKHLKFAWIFKYTKKHFDRWILFWTYFRLYFTIELCLYKIINFASILNVQLSYCWRTNSTISKLFQSAAIHFTASLCPTTYFHFVTAKLLKIQTWNVVI